MGSGENTAGDAEGDGIAFRLRQAYEADSEALRDALDDLNDRIRENGANDGGASPIRFSTIARVILYLAIELGEAARKKTGSIQPQWSGVIRRYEAFCAQLPAGLLPTCNDDDMRMFCQFSSRRNGSQTPRFYSGLAAFVIAEAERGRLDSAFMKVALPDCERSAGDICRDVLLPICDRCVGVAAPTAASPVAPAHPEVSLHFAFVPSNIARFDTYRRLFAVTEDRFAHFVVYRASRTRPARLMKSYLAISEPRMDGQVGYDLPATFKFVHIYRPPDTSGVPRVSLGRVLTFEHGVYLIGGQRDETTERRPFQSLKVMALPWLQLNREDKLLSALLLSSNYSGEQIVSRAAMRTTIIGKSDGIELGSVNIDELKDDLVADAVRERAAAEESGEVSAQIMNLFPLACAAADRPRAADRMSKNIMRLTNNSAAWELGHNYKRQRTRSEESLTRARIDVALDREFGSEDNPVYRCAEMDDEVFDFWNSLRFGPLTQD